MPSYSYTARDMAGKLVVGTLTGPNEQTVRERLREGGLYASDVNQRTAEGMSWFTLRKRVKLADLVVFTQQLSAMIGAGLPLLECLDALVEQTDNQTLRLALIEVNRDIQTGSTFSEALSRFPNIFNELFVSMVHAGEIGGVLDECLSQLAETFDKELELREKVKSAFIYPVIVLTVAVGVVTFMLLFVVPVFKQVYGYFKATLPTPTLLLIALSNLVVNWWWVVLLVLAAAVVAFQRVAATRWGKRRLDRIKLRLPLLGRLNRKICTLRLVRTLGAMIGAGVPLLQALETAGRVTGNSEIEEAVDQVSAKVNQGSILSEPLRATGQFPGMVCQMIQAGEESGNLDDMLKRLSAYFERDIEYTVRRLTTLMEPALTLVLGGIVGFLVVSMYMPIFRLAVVVRKT